MMTKHYASLFVRGDRIKAAFFRESLNPIEIEADLHVFYRENVGQDVGMVGFTMFTFRTVQPPNLGVFDRLAARWPELQLTLLHRTFGLRPESGFVVYEQGERVRYGGARVAPGNENQNNPVPYPSQKLFGRHVLTEEQIEKRMRGSGIQPDDPVEDRRRDAEDW